MVKEDKKSKKASEIIDIIVKLQEKVGLLVPFEYLEKETGLNKRELLKILENREGVDIVGERNMVTINPYFKKETKDEISGESMIIKVRQPNTEQPSYLWCDKIEYWHDKGKDKTFGQIFDHHLMIYKNGNLIFKVWLPNSSKDKEFKDVREALKSVGMEV